MPFLDTFIHWLHLMSAIVWIGGMIFAGWILTPVARVELPSEIRFPFYKKIGKRFYLLGWSALAVLILTGTYKIVSGWDSLEALLSSAYGKVLSLKLLLVGAMLFLSYLHDFVWAPKLLKLNAELTEKEYLRTVAHLSFWARINILLGIAIVFLGAYLRIHPF